MPAVDIDAAWEYIQQGVSVIMTHGLERIRLTTEMYMNMYTAIHNFCVSPHPPPPTRTTGRQGRGEHTKLLGGELYQRLQEFLEQHLANLYADAPQTDQEDVIEYYNACWKRYVTGATFLDHIFAYLNRHWIKQERDEGGRKRGVFEVNTLCLVLWRDHMFERLRPQLISALLALIERDRNGQPVDFQLLHTCIESMVTVGFDDQSSKRTNLLFYSDHFEKPFIAATAAYYARESQVLLATRGVVKYMRRISQRLAEEKERVLRYLHPSTEELLMAECERLLIETHEGQIQGEFLRLLAENQGEDLLIMYTLLCKVQHGLEPVRKNLQSFVECTGMESVEQLVQSSPQSATATNTQAVAAVDPKSYVQVLLGECTRFEKLLITSFENSAAMKAAIDKGCARFINSNAVAKPSAAADSRTPELLARYADSLLKKSSKNSDLETVEQGIEGILRILQYTEEKDVFEKHYSRLLSRRLVHQASASPDLELRMVTRLTEYCGFEYANKLQRMFQDITTSDQLQTQFKVEEGRPTAFSFAPFVLAEGFWPLPYREVSGFELPQPLRDTFDHFVTYYDKIHSGRRLKWLWNFGKGEMKLNMPNGKIVLLQVSIYQMMILLAFNDADTLTRAQLLQDVHLPAELLDGSLDYIVKAQILVETALQTFSFNTDFKPRRLRINLNLPLKVEQSQEASETEKQIEEQRQGFLQAVIVRVMKARKTLGHAQLVEEVMEQARSRFIPSVKDVKRALTVLLEREYLRRVGNDDYEYSS